MRSLGNEEYQLGDILKRFRDFDTERCLWMDAPFRILVISIGEFPSESCSLSSSDMISLGDCCKYSRWFEDMV